MTTLTERIAVRPWNLKRDRILGRRINVQIEGRRFQVSTVHSWLDFYKVLRFRREVFLEEFIAPRWAWLDLDRHDWDSDHLTVTDRESGQIIGCYRLRNSIHHEIFFSESEYDLGQIKNLEGVKVELGRACVHPQYRNGATLQLLWRGLGEYARQAKADYLFGSASLRSTDPLLARRFEIYFQTKGIILPWPHVELKSEYHFSDVEQNSQNLIRGLSPEEMIGTENRIPPLLRLYLRAGAKICGAVGIDRKFRCLDFFTLLELDNMPHSIAEKYGLR